MTAQVIHLPRKPAAVLEPRVIGAVLAIGATKILLTASGVSDTDFEDPRCRVAWRIVRRFVEAGRPVSAATIGAAGVSAKAWGPEAVEWLEAVQHENLIGPGELADVLSEMRAAAKAQRIAGVLTTMAAELQAGGWDAAKLHADLRTAQALLLEPGGDTRATADLLELYEKWDTNESRGRSDLVTTGLRALDDIVGGYPPSLVIVYGKPGAGKTGVIASGIRGQLLSDPTMEVGIFGLEDGTRWFTRRNIALEAGWVLREVGWKKRSAEDAERLQLAGNRLQALTDRVLTYQGRITSAELLRRAAAWCRTRPNLRCLYIDNNSQVQLGGDPRVPIHEKMEAFAEALRELAESTGVPVVSVAHINEGDVPSNGPPPPAAVRGGRAIDQKARLMLAVWSKGEEWRVTVTKANESGGRDTTLALTRHKEAALVDTNEGAIVNLREEHRQDSEASARARVALRAKLAAEAAAKRAAAKAELDKAKGEGAQGELLPPVTRE